MRIFSSMCLDTKKLKVKCLTTKYISLKTYSKKKKRLSRKVPNWRVGDRDGRHGHLTCLFARIDKNCFSQILFLSNIFLLWHDHRGSTWESDRQIVTRMSPIHKLLNACYRMQGWELFTVYLLKIARHCDQAMFMPYRTQNWCIIYVSLLFISIPFLSDCK